MNMSKSKKVEEIWKELTPEEHVLRKPEQIPRALHILDHSVFRGNSPEPIIRLRTTEHPDSLQGPNYRHLSSPHQS